MYGNQGLQSWIFHLSWMRISHLWSIVEFHLYILCIRLDIRQLSRIFHIIKYSFSFRNIRMWHFSLKSFLTLFHFMSNLNEIIKILVFESPIKIFHFEHYRWMLLDLHNKICFLYKRHSKKVSLDHQIHINNWYRWVSITQIYFIDYWQKLKQFNQGNTHLYFKM